MAGMKRGPRIEPQLALLLELSEGGFANYSVRWITQPCPVSAELYVPEDAVITFSCGDLSKTLSLCACDKPVNVELFTLPCGQMQTVRVQVKSGTARISWVRFPL